MLEAKNITFSYGKAGPVFEGLSLSIAPGERVAIQAPSGRGKTTLCKVLSGYLEPTEGSVEADGRPLPKAGAYPVQLIMQHPELAVDPRMRMEQTLKEAGSIDADLNEKFGTKDIWMRRFPHELSGGELQRFCIVRALMINPSYVIADEISTMLDAVTQAQIWYALLDEQKSRNFGLVFTTHNIELTNTLATRTIDITKECDKVTGTLSH